MSTHKKCPQCGDLSFPRDFPKGQKEGEEVCQVCYEQNIKDGDEVAALEATGHSMHCARRMV